MVQLLGGAVAVLFDCLCLVCLGAFIGLVFERLNDLLHPQKDALIHKEYQLLS